MKDKRQDGPTIQTYIDSRVNDMQAFLLSHIDDSRLGLSNRDNDIEAQLDRRVKALEQDLIERICALRREQTAISLAAKESTAKAETSIDRRLTAMNEFRDALVDQSQTFLRRETFDSTFEAWLLWRAQVDKQLNESVGKETGQAHISDRVFNTIALIISLIAMGATIAIAIGHP